MRGLKEHGSRAFRSGSLAVLLGAVASGSACVSKSEAPEASSVATDQEIEPADRKRAEEAKPAPAPMGTIIPPGTEAVAEAPAMGAGGLPKGAQAARPMRGGDGKDRSGEGIFAPSPSIASSARPADVAPAEAAIDPNGRFATTYRPGGGHLAAFESAVARGIIPAGERELVSDVGARYAPAMDPPGKGALA
ncbi:MAG TPA: hypothetical protein VLS89_15665, partial [Candidatus Nanopelagicales bacterium]|nr:hypothetical protein [Candidatus Nanopelagicales bacterium]